VELFFEPAPRHRWTILASSSKPPSSSEQPLHFVPYSEQQKLTELKMHDVELKKHQMKPSSSS